jgi:peptidyl-prolyl cis-trans isomerase C
MKSFAFARVLALSGLAAAAVAQQPAPATPPQSGPALAPVTAPTPETNVAPDSVVITIGAQNVTRAQFELLLAAIGNSTAPAAQKRRVAEQYAELETLVQEAHKRKLDETASPEVKTLIKIQSDGALAAGLQKQISDDTHFSELDIRSYYDTHKGEFEEAKASHILIRFKGSNVPLKPAEKDLTPEEALAKAQDLRKQIVAGADFAAIAKAESDDPGTAPKGGDLGTFRHGQMVPQFDQAAFSLPVGEVSEPVRTQFGYHLIKVTTRNAKSFDEAKPQIEKELKPKMAKDTVDQIKAHTAVTLNDAYFGAVPNTTGPQTLPAPAPSK